ncbi:MAG: phosphoglycerate dehydrogenase [Raoultibacter sp.]|jgi:D-3-phosphoglycerate dehydrogenase
MADKVLVSEKLAEEGIKILQDKGFEVDVILDMSPEELVATIPGYAALIVRSATTVTREVIEAGTDLRVIGRAGVGIDNVDVEASTENGIIVCNAPFSNVTSAAEQTMCLMLACARNTPQAYNSMHAGKWERGDFTGVELYKKTLAIFGLGRIGGLVADRARAFGMNLIGYDPYCTPERAKEMGITLYDSVDEIVPLADFITVHLPKTKETIGMFGPAQFAAMKDGVILVNTARGGIYDVDGLAEYIASGKIRAAGIDVYEKEPCSESPLHGLKNVILTPHLGASTKEAQARAGAQIGEYVAAGLEGAIVPTAVNMAPVPPEVMEAVGPYVPACQMMGSLLNQLTGELPQYLKITAAGTLAGTDISILESGALGGILEGRVSTSVTPVNSEALARRYDIKVKTASTPDAKEYASTVSLNADGEEVACTLTGSGKTPRIVSLLGYAMEVVPGPHSLIFEYVDSPGKIGTIGTILGNAGINITTMQVGMKEDEKNALVFMNIESALTDDIMDEIRDAVELKNLWLVKL